MIAPMKPTQPKPPPAPWFKGIIRNSVDGFKVGTQVAFRRSREGGWRVMSKTRQIVLSDETVSRFVITLRTGGKPQRVADQEAANRHLADIFRGRVLLGKTVPGSPYTDLRMGGP